MSLFNTFDLLGTVAFAISGASVAIKKKFDPFGIFIISFVTATGGGTIRDVLLGLTPVSWVQSPNTFYIVIVSTILTMILKDRVAKLRKSLFLFDTIGLGIFTIIGVEKGLSLDLNPIFCIALGTITGSFGGVVRDILCNDVPVIFKQEIYALACVAGGSLFMLLLQLNIPINYIYISTASMVILIRLIVVRYQISLPSLE